MLRERKEEDREKTAKEAGKQENILNFVCFLTLDDNVHAYLKTSF